MAITTLCELRPFPDQADAVIQRAAEQLSLPSRSVAERRFARLYQHVDDPASLLYLAEWNSREAFDAYRAAAPQPGAPSQFERPPTFRFYQRIALFERMLVPAAFVHVSIVDGPAASHALRRDLALTYHRSAGAAGADLVLLQVHEMLDNAPSLLVVTGWEALAQPKPPAHTAAEALLEQLVARGGTARQFVGQTVAETPAV